MKRELSTPALGAILVACAVHAWAQSSPGGAAAPQEPPCLKGKEADRLRTSDFFEAVKLAMVGEQCSSVLRVLSELQSKRVSGGRKLHDKPFDRAAAQKELQAARADAGFVATLGTALQGISDANARKGVEAAVLENLGYFGARQLLVEELMQTQGAR